MAWTMPRLVVAALVLSADAMAASQQGVNLVPPEGLASLQPVRETPTRARATVSQGRMTIDVFEMAPNWWDVQYGAMAPSGVNAGDVILFRLKARTISARTESGEGTLSFYLQRGEEPWNSVMETTRRIPIVPKEIALAYRATDSLPAGKVRLTLNAGYAVQKVELWDLVVENLGPNADISKLAIPAQTYAGIEPNAPWRKAAEKRIEEIRKAPFSIKVLDSRGRPVKGAKVTVKLARHAFPFGSVFSYWIPKDTADGKAYWSKFRTHFNMTVDEGGMKWPSWEGDGDIQKSAKIQNDIDQILAMFDKWRVPVRGHNMVWPGYGTRWKYLPADVERLTREGRAEELRLRLRQRILSLGTWARGRVVDWDVVNEAVENRDLQGVLGTDVLVEWFKWAREADPMAKLYYNDYCMLSGGANDPVRLERLEALLQNLVAKGAPLDGIGEQAHFGEDVVEPERILKILDRFGRFGLPIRITEFDHATSDEAFQAQYMRDFLTAVFSHPSVNGFVLWGFWEGAHWMPSAALYRKDWTIKPNGLEFERLTQKVWTTNLILATDAQGLAKGRGFLGEYVVSASMGSAKLERKWEIAKEGNSLTLSFKRN